MNRLRLSYLRLAILAFALLSVGAQSMVARGFMAIAQTDKAGVSIVICTGTGPKTINIDGEHTPDGKKSAAANHCPFAPVVAHDTAPPVPALAFAPLPQSVQPALRVSVGLRPLTVHTYLSQGPPALSA